MKGSAMTQSFSILDLPEPLRSQALAERGMTADEFTAYMEGREAHERELRRQVESGEVQPAPEFHYGDDLPLARVVKQGA
jgi:hypothetical protein